MPQLLGLYWLNEETVSRRGDLPTLEYLQIQKIYRQKFADSTPPPPRLPAGAVAQYHAIASLLEEQHYAEALPLLERFTERHPSFPEAHHDLAETYYRNQEIGLARKHFEKATILDPSSQLFRQKLESFQLLGLLGESHRHYLRFAAANPADIETRLILGMLLLVLGRFEAAESHYRAALRIDPKNMTACKNLEALTQHVGGEISPSHESAAPAIQQGPPSVGHQPDGSTAAVIPGGNFLVSAIVSTYNAEIFLRGCLEDLEAQTIADRLEIIVVDSGSEQNERDIVQEFQGRYQNIRYIRTARENLYQAWNRGVRAATGKYLTDANTDDRHRPDALEVMAATLEAHPGIALVYADQLYTDRPNETFQTTSCRKQRVWGEYAGTQTIRSHCMVSSQPMWRRSLHLRYGFFDDSFASAGDWEFWLRIASSETFLKIDQVLGLYYENPDGIENSHPASEAEAMRVRNQYQIEPHEQRFPAFAVYTPRSTGAQSRHPGPGSKPRVSVIIPCYNYANFLPDAVGSVISQTYQSFEIIIVNDGSTDNTIEVAEQLIDSLHSFSIRLVNQENSGQPAFSRNAGIAKAVGAYILCLDADDTLGQTYLAACVAELEGNARISIVYGDQQNFGKSSLFEPHPDFDARNLLRFNFIPAAALFRKEAWLDAGGYRPSKFSSGSYEDWAFWISCLGKGHLGGKTAGAVWNYRIHGESQYQKSQLNDQALKAEIICNTPGCYSETQLKWGRSVLDEVESAKWFGLAIGIMPDDSELERWLALREPEAQAAASLVPAAQNGLRVLFTMYGWNESGGGTTFPKSVARELAARGNQVSVFYASLKSDRSQPAYALDATVDDRVNLYGVYNRPALFTDPDNPEREIHDEGILSHFRQVLREVQPDVVHFHNFHGLTLAMAQEVKKLGIPSCFTPHNYHMIDPNLYLFDRDLCLWNGTDPLKNSEAVRNNPGKREWYQERVRVTRNLLNDSVDLVLAVSSRQRDLLIDYGAAPGRITVVHQANKSADTLWAGDRPVREPRLPGQPLRIGFIGAVTRYKGVHMLVAAAQHFAPADAEFHIFGAVAEDLRDTLKSFDHKKMVTFHGSYGQSDLQSIAGKLDVAVVPSVTEDCAPLVILELLAMRLPVIAARIGGIPDFIHEHVNGYLYQYDSVDALVRAISSCLGDSKQLTKLRNSIQQTHSFAGYLAHLQGIYAALASGTLATAADFQLLATFPGASPAATPLPGVVWEGSQFVGHSLALVNRELCLQLIDAGYPVSIVPYEQDEFGVEADPRFAALAERVNAALPEPAAVHVRHQWPPDFTPPAEGHWVMIQPWEFGALPKAWIETMSTLVDEVWVPSSYVRDCYIRSGMSADRVFTVPNGVNTELFRPGARAFPLKTTKRFKFLFVGGTIHRKGIDILIQAYAMTFRRSDDVCLVIKDLGGNSLYEGQTAGQMIERYQGDNDLPEIEYLDRFLTDHELAGLYTACDCFVHPYRGEGFGLPIAEAMACGLATVVTGYGAALDFCSPATAYLIPAHEVPLAGNLVGNKETVGRPWLAEPEVNALSAIMLRVSENPEEAKARGKAASSHIRQNFTWHNALAAASQRLQELVQKPVRRFSTRQRPGSVPDGPPVPVPVGAGEELTSIVIVASGDSGCSGECLESLERNTPELHEVILVDSCSTDAARLRLRDLCAGKSRYRFIENAGKPGLDEGYQIGTQLARGARILFLSGNAAVTSGWLGGMLHCLERGPAAAIVGPMTNDGSGPQRVGNVDYQSIGELETFSGDFRTLNSCRRIPVDRLLGFCLLFTRTVLEAVGEFDARLGSDCAVDDFCLRASLAGFDSVIAGDVFVHQHPGPRSNGDGTEGGAGRRAAFAAKWDLAGLDEAQAKKVVSRNAREKGRRLSRQGRLDDAVEVLLHEGIKFSPADSDPYRLLAEVLTDAGSFQNALEVLGEMPAGDEEARLLLTGHCQRGLGQSEQARQLAEQVLRLNPNSAGALCLKGDLAIENGETLHAEELFRSAVEADPGFGLSYSGLSAIAWEAGSRDQALRLAELGFLLSPLEMTALARFNDYATELDLLPREEQRVREARAVHPEHKGLAFGLIDILIRRCSYQDAMAEIEKAAVAFGMDDATLGAALQIRGVIGQMKPEAGKRNTISACLIVRDEAQCLPAALLSLKPLADEIIVVDTGSTDKSIKIARMFGCEVFSFPWNDNFSEARNFSLSKASGDWVLGFDADEQLAAGDLAAIAELLERSTEPTAYSFPIRNYTDRISQQDLTANTGEYPGEERGLGWTRSERPRLFPNDSRIRYAGVVHETVVDSLLDCAVTIRTCDIPVHHYGKLNEAKSLEKQEYYYLLGVRKLEETGGGLKALLELAIQATELRRFQEAEALWHKLLRALPENADAYFNLGYIYLSVGDYRKARLHALQGARLAPEMKEAAFNLAKCELYLGHTEQALAGCREMLRQWPDYPPALSLLSVCSLILGSTGDAEAVVERLRCMHFDCGDFLKEYADGLNRGDRGDLAATLERFAERIAGEAGGPRNCYE